jgi:hypothetical protein
MKIKKPVDIDFTKLNTTLSNFLLYGPDLKTKIVEMSFWIIVVCM